MKTKSRVVLAGDWASVQTCSDRRGEGEEEEEEEERIASITVLHRKQKKNEVEEGEVSEMKERQQTLIKL